METCVLETFKNCYSKLLVLVTMGLQESGQKTTEFLLTIWHTLDTHILEQLCGLFCDVSHLQQSPIQHIYQTVA